jgi:hypothetical protein
MAGNISMGARREVVSAVVERYRSAGQREKGRILDELTAVTGWHRKHAVRVHRLESGSLLLSSRESSDATQLALSSMPRGLKPLGSLAPAIVWHQSTTLRVTKPLSFIGIWRS